MSLGRTVAFFGLLSTVWQCTWLVVHHPGGYHMAIFDPRWALPLRLLDVGIYVGAGFVAARQSPYAGVPVSVVVAGVGFVLGSALSYLVVPGSMDLLVDARFWGMNLRFGGVLEIAFGVAGGAIGTALSLLPILRTAGRST